MYKAGEELLLRRPVPQGSAPPGSGAVWTEELGWVVPFEKPSWVLDLAGRRPHLEIWVPPWFEGVVAVTDPDSAVDFAEAKMQGDSLRKVAGKDSFTIYSSSGRGSTVSVKVMG